MHDLASSRAFMIEKWRDVCETGGWILVGCCGVCYVGGGQRDVGVGSVLFWGEILFDEGEMAVA